MPGVVDFAGSTDESRRKAIAHSAKSNFLVVDCVDNSLSHKVVTVADVLSGNEETMRDAVVRSALSAKDPVDIDEAALAASWEQEVAEHAALRRRRAQIEADAKFNTLDVDAFDGGLVQTRDVKQFTPATAKQLKLLRWKWTAKVDDWSTISKGVAGAMIGHVMRGGNPHTFRHKKPK